MATVNPENDVKEFLGHKAHFMGTNLEIVIGHQENLYRWEARYWDGTRHQTYKHGCATPYRKVAIRWAKKEIGYTL